MPEIEVEFVAGRPRGFHTELPHGLMYHRGPPAILLVPAEAARRMPEVVSGSLADMRLVTIPVARLVELVERVTLWLWRRMAQEPAEEVEQAFCEHCYLAVMPGHISLALRNPRESAGVEVVRVKLAVEHRVVDGRGFRFGAGKVGRAGGG
jgi:hypothetical protein